MNRMKYVVAKHGDNKEEIFIFPCTIDHDAFAEVLSYVKTGGRNWKREFRTPVSAGFTDGNTCFGRSETLNLDSRKDIDTAMLKSSVAVTPTELAIFPTGDEIHALADGNTGMLLDDNFIDKLNTLAKQLKEGKYQQDEIESLHSVYQGMLKESQANIVALQSELTVAKINQARYLWIRNESWAQYNMHKGKPHLVTFNAIGRPTHLAEDAVDEEIDKAILEDTKR